MRFAKRSICAIMACLLAASLTLSGCNTSTPSSSASSSAPVTPSSSSEAVTPPVETPKDKPAYSIEGFETANAQGRITTGRDASGKEAMVSASKFEASQVGKEIMEKGGNAIDAAVAVGFAQGVVEPHTSGLGGGGLMTLHTADGKDIFVDFREIAPAAATPDMYKLDKDGKVIDNKMVLGGLASGVPGEVAGLLYLLDNYGTMTRQEVMAPAIRIAEEGFTVSPFFEGVLKDKMDVMVKFPELQKIYWKSDLQPWLQGDVIKNPDLAKTLKLISEKGADGFYKGEVAEAVIASNKKYGGILTMEDLANYKPTVREPVKGTYRGYQIISSPPPSSGGAHLIQILNLLEKYDISKMEVNSPEYIHIFSEVFKLSYADRGQYMADTDFVKVPLGGITSKKYADMLSKKIDPNKSLEYKYDDPWQYEHEDTTHFSIADKAGNMVGITKTVNYFFGSGVLVDGYGFPLNDQMDDFVSNPEHANRVEPGKKPLSSMTPTVVLDKDGKPFMVLGTPGSSKIFATVAQVISRVVDHKMDIQDAINAPRIWDSTATNIYFEPAMPGQKAISEATFAKLKEMGHVVSDNGLGGCVQAIVYQPDGTLRGAADPRQDGKAVGY